MDWKRENLILRCKDCRTVDTQQAITARGHCDECGSTMMKIAWKISDAEEKALAAKGFVFTEEQFSSDPNFTFAKE